MEGNTVLRPSPEGSSPLAVSTPGTLKTEKDYRKVSPTAISCAGARALFTHMPYAMDIYSELLEGNGGMESKVKNWAMQVMLRIPFVSTRLSRISVLEGRHYANNAAISSVGADVPILEIAAGLSTRGLELGRNRAYIETDLDEMIGQKMEIATAILNKRGQGIPATHLFLPMNALDYAQLKHAAEALRRIEPFKPFALVHEGLMMFLDDEEQSKLRNNIHRLFQEFNPHGWWITTDFTFKSEEYFNKSYRKQVEKGTERLFNSFTSDEEIVSFMNEGGLKVEIRDSSEIARNLSCIRKLKLKLDDVMKYAHQYRVAVATLK